jgi:hypothetical protein
LKNNQSIIPKVVKTRPITIISPLVIVKKVVVQYPQEIVIVHQPPIVETKIVKEECNREHIDTFLYNSNIYNKTQKPKWKMASCFNKVEEYPISIRPTRTYKSNKSKKCSI